VAAGRLVSAAGSSSTTPPTVGHPHDAACNPRATRRDHHRHQKVPQGAAAQAPAGVPLALVSDQVVDPAAPLIGRALRRPPYRAPGGQRAEPRSGRRTSPDASGAAEGHPWSGSRWALDSRARPGSHSCRRARRLGLGMAGRPPARSVLQQWPTAPRVTPLRRPGTKSRM
jgi:hypothetical protein